MSTFKLKSEKNKCLAQLQTLDGTHKMYESNFNAEKNHLPQKKKALGTLESKLEKLHNKNKEEFTTFDIQQKSLFKSKIEKLKKEIYDIENNINELEYYSMTENLLMEYYELVEKYDDTEHDDQTGNKPNDNSNNDELYDMSELDKLNKLKLSNKKRKLRHLPRKRKTDVSSKQTDDIMGYFGMDSEKPSADLLEVNRKTLLDNFLTLVNSDYASDNKRRKTSKKCTKCDVDKTLVQSEGFYVCNLCGEIEHVIIEHERSGSKDPMPEKSGYPYKRINHLNEWIAQFQAKESTEIPSDIYDQILFELKKNRIRDFSKLTLKKMKSILKKLRLNQYYEHIPHIISKINKLPPPTISREMEEELRRMFKEMQDPFERHRPKDRTNFLNYSYVLHKLCQLLELDHILRCFPLLKSRDKLRLQDVIWAKICKDCRWKFYPSV